MNVPIRKLDRAETFDLTVQERRLIETLRKLQDLNPEAFHQVEKFLWSLVGQSLKWSYEDPESIAKALEFAALDPYLHAEIKAINREFSQMESDGLEDY